MEGSLSRDLAALKAGDSADCALVCGLYKKEVLCNKFVLAARSGLNRFEGP